MVRDHLDYWIAALAALLPERDIRLTFTSFDSPVLQERFSETVMPTIDPGYFVASPVTKLPALADSRLIRRCTRTLRKLDDVDTPLLP
ncbi:MAG: hypothetical protein M3Q75_07915 [Gemmatimonadota bacterium]|nr:hypothetical protein [Gemmatimonadota bacterium]